eukprot:5786058-Prymnesium_polylepis.1
MCHIAVWDHHTRPTALLCAHCIAACPSDAWCGRLPRAFPWESRMGCTDAAHCTGGAPHTRVVGPCRLARPGRGWAERHECRVRRILCNRYGF